MEIRAANHSDLAGVAAIYEHEAREGHATFDVEGRSVATWQASRALHRACGFDAVGVMREVGWKHGRWVDVEWWQRVLR